MKKLREWIRQNRHEIDELIRRACPNIGPLNDDDRRQWILNDEGLYLWAKAEGTNVNTALLVIDKKGEEDNESLRDEAV